ncbi:ATP-dependent nuclease, partial [Thermobrachium celere]|uniref:ATP-dependent nuclease n=1 Tax=Thermobrachium celere TaxID=53422 RepID=UPI0019409235
MKIKTVKIHNFRSIKDAEFDMEDYSLLIGKNNSGKTNILTALRIFYDDIKFDENIDYPKFKDLDDNESWIEIEYKLTNNELMSLKEEYRYNNSGFKIRKYLKTQEPGVKANQFYVYERQELSKNLFYGARNAKQAKIGNLIYIPDVSKSDEILKLSGPSPFRDLLNYVIKKVIKNSEAYKELACSFNKFNNDFKNEKAEEGISINRLVEDINNNIENWGIKFGIDINPIQEDDIIKNLINHYIEDNNLEGKININRCGQGVQRYLIYTLITLASKYTNDVESSNEFNPDFTLILFEEPEAFLHPTQQEILNINLREMANNKGVQVLLTTHSNVFISQNIDELTSLCKVTKFEGKTILYQISKEELEELYDENLSIYKKFKDLLENSDDENLKKQIINKKLASENENIEDKLQQETIKYFLWLDAEKTSMFFADHVLLCEGASEKVFFDFLIKTKWSDIKIK